MMAKASIELALGTAQFGLSYGIANANKLIRSQDVKQILTRAWELGIRVIDTAPVYGDIEARLFDETMSQDGFSVVSKIPAISQKLSKEAVEDHVSESIYKSQSRLRARLQAILFHRGLDLLDKQGEVAWESANRAIEGTGIKLGVSCYSPNELNRIGARFPITIAQLPGNALDQRLVSMKNSSNIELHLRSVFLQGALLLAPQEVSVKLPQAMKEMAIWRAWCDVHGLTPLQASLSIAKGFSNVRYCVVGVDGVHQLEAIAEAWSYAVPLNAPTLATDKLEVIDPRYWHSCATSHPL